jgi:predicted MFS family arabinose efflux permease
MYTVVICETKRQSIHSATAQDVHTMIIGRLLAGTGIGISSALNAVYISEIVIC